MRSLPTHPTRRRVALLAGAFLIFAGCSGGEQKPILAKTVKAFFAQSPPPVSDGLVYFGNVSTQGDTISLDVLVQDSTGTLDVDDADLVLRYDSTFIQISSLAAQNALFGTCNTVNPACSLVSPVCADNRPQANGGQGSPGNSEYCRSNGTKACTVSTVKVDCPTAGDGCGVFGRLEAAFAVVTGPKICTNNPSPCFQNSDCLFCQSSPGLSCTTPIDCSGTCVSGTCTKPSTRSCTVDPDCADPCGAGLCQGCPSVVISGARKIATLTLRVMKEGTSDFRFVVSPTPGTPGVSALRKDLVDRPVLFFPNVDNNDPSIQNGAIAIVGSL